MPLTLLGLLAVLHPAADGLSPAAKAGKAVFEGLSTLASGVGEARIADLRMAGAPEYLGSPEGMDGLSALGKGFEKHPELAAEAFRLYADVLPRMGWLRGWDGGEATHLARIARGRVEPALAERVRTESVGLLERTISKQESASPKPVGKTAVDLFRLDLSDLRGKVVVLDFWVTWCKPCMGFFPRIREIAGFFVRLGRDRRSAREDRRPSGL